MLQKHGYHKDIKSVCKMIKPVWRDIVILFSLTTLLVIFAAVCIIHIDSVCELDLEPLPEDAELQAEVTEQPEPAAPIYDIPLSRDLQEFTYQKCIEYDVDYVMVLAIMQEESGIQPDLIEDGNYGLMQINESNFEYLRNALGTTDFLDPEQNIEAGIFWLSGICENNSDPERILMVYSMNGSVAQAMWDLGRESSWYSREVMRFMDEIKEKQVLI